MKNILVTGGTGYIGSHTVVELLNRGYEVSIIDNLSNSRKEVLDAIQLITGKKPVFEEMDLCNKNEVYHFFKHHKTDAIIHFAAYKAVGESVLEPMKYYRNNIISLLNLLDATTENNINHFVFSSSCSVYGQSEKMPVHEDDPIPPAASPYGTTKQLGERIVEDVARVSDFNAITLRYFNPAGAHESALIGEYPLDQPANLVPIIMQTATGKRNSMTIFGNDYSTPDGTCIRDYIHVTDIAKAHVVAIDRLISRKNKSQLEVFNLGTGKGNSVLEAIQAFEKVSGVKLNYQIGKRRKGDVEKVWADTTRANEVLGWKAEQSLEDIMSSAWKWEHALEKKSALKQ